MNLKKWTFTLNLDQSCARTVTTTEHASLDVAWAKFAHQYFGALKPCRDDYRVTSWIEESR